MASGEDVVADAPVLPGARRQRPPAVIDLTAREVASEPDATSPAEPAAADAPAASQTAMPQNPGPDPAGAGGGAGEAPVPPPPPLDRGRRPRRGTFIAFATAGAGIALLAVGLMWLADTFAPHDSAATDELSARIARLDLQMRDVANRPVVAADPKTVADLGPRIDALAEGLRRLDGIEARLARQETGLARQESAAQAPRPAPAPDTALADRLAAAEARLGALAGTVADLRPRIDAVAEKAPAPSAPPDNAAIEALAGRVAALEGALKATDEKLSKSAAGGNSDAPVRLALVALELRVAVERGVPFAVELAAAKPLVADKSLLAALEPVAPLGVPTAQALSRELANVAPAMLRAAGAPAHEGGLLDRLQANAERLVRIRPIAEAPGSDPSTVIVRAEVKATRGDLAGALAEIVGLPADIKAPGAGWIRSAEMRLAAVEAAQKFSTSALAGLGKPSP